ncbi:hypothetical protein LXL04_012682 [Taraxacum kok-saghyz]
MAEQILDEQVEGLSSPQVTTMMLPLTNMVRNIKFYKKEITTVWSEVGYGSMVKALEDIGPSMQKDSVALASIPELSDSKNVKRVAMYQPHDDTMVTSEAFHCLAG